MPGGFRFPVKDQGQIESYKLLPTTNDWWVEEADEPASAEAIHHFQLVGPALLSQQNHSGNGNQTGNPPLDLDELRKNLPKEENWYERNATMFEEFLKGIGKEIFKHVPQTKDSPRPPEDSMGDRG